MAPTTSLELRNITKQFPGVTALSDVSFKIDGGSVHGVCGENGAGKSTLIKIMSGVYAHGTFSGELLVDGIPVHFTDIKDAERLGIITIYQELSLFNKLSVTENIFVENMTTRGGLIDWDHLLNQTRDLLTQLELTAVSPEERVENLGIGQQQLIEIARALAKDAKVLILDEPTSALAEHEVETLFRIVRKLRDKGVTCIYISHRLSEITRIADSVSVLRDGQFVGQDDVRNMTVDKLIYMMVGRQMENLFPEHTNRREQKVLCVRDLSLLHPSIPQKKILDGINFEAYRGELLGIAGLMGSGRTELATAIFGIGAERRTGEIQLDGSKIDIRSPSQAIANGLAYLSEDRKRYGLVLNMSVKDNMTLANLNRGNRTFLHEGEEVVASSKYVADLAIKTPSILFTVSNLSGGNQQKVVLGKWLMTEPKVMILDEVTRGIDVGAKFEIYKIINSLVASGVVVILISSELPELLGMCDRILVMRNGRISGEVAASDASQEQIMRLATA